MACLNRRRTRFVTRLKIQIRTAASLPLISRRRRHACGRVLRGKKYRLYAADNVCKIIRGISDNKCCVAAPPSFTLYKLTLYETTVTYCATARLIARYFTSNYLITRRRDDGTTTSTGGGGGGGREERERTRRVKASGITNFHRARRRFVG